MSQTPPQQGAIPGPDSRDESAAPSWSDIVSGEGETAPAAPPASRREAREREAAHASGRVRSRRAEEPAESYGFPQAAPPRKKKRRWLGWVIAPLVVVLVLGGGSVAAAWLLFPQQVKDLVYGPEETDYPGSGSGSAVLVIHDGDIGEDIAKNLVAAGVTMTFDSFYDVLVATEPAPVFQPGAYQLKQKMSARSALAALLDPANKVENQVVVPEGEVASSVLPQLADALQVPLDQVQAAAADVGSFGLPAGATTLEGFLFPATYQFDPGTTPHDALQAMVYRSFQALDSAGVAVDDRYRVVTLAALIQREAGLREDYYKVSRVFQNRLDQGMLLQSDATVAYGSGNTHRVATTDAEREDANNPYNTYIHPGLPVGPISNPGDLAIDAALHPADGPWLYFVTVNLETGETVFSETDDQHQQAVDQWLSWMDDHPEYQ